MKTVYSDPSCGPQTQAYNSDLKSRLMMATSVFKPDERPVVDIPPVNADACDIITIAFACNQLAAITLRILDYHSYRPEARGCGSLAASWSSNRAGDSGGLVPPFLGPR